VSLSFPGELPPALEGADEVVRWYALIDGSLAGLFPTRSADAPGLRSASTAVARAGETGRCASRRPRRAGRCFFGRDGDYPLPAYADTIWSLRAGDVEVMAHPETELLHTVEARWRSRSPASAAPRRPEAGLPPVRGASGAIPACPGQSVATVGKGTGSHSHSKWEPASIGNR
jgi:hypothetical protein